MAIHRLPDVPKYPAGPCDYPSPRSDLINYNGPPFSRGVVCEERIELPPIRTIGLHWGGSSCHGAGGAQDRESALLDRPPRQVLAVEQEASPAALSHSLTLSSLAGSCLHSPSGNTLVETQHLLSGPFGDMPEGLKERAADARNVIRRCFGQMPLQVLRRFKRTIDPNRLLYREDAKPNNRKGAKTTSVHSRQERLRREAHAVFLVELGKRAGDAIMELAGYPIGSRKSPGKIPLLLGAIFQKELDDLIDERAEQRIRDLEYRLRMSEQDQVQRYSRSPVRRSFTPDVDDLAIESPRKRQRRSNDDTIASKEPKALAWRGVPHESGHYYRRDSVTKPVECSAREMSKDVPSPHKIFQPRHEQHSTLPSPALSDGSWTIVSRRPSTPSSASAP